MKKKIMALALSMLLCVALNGITADAGTASYTTYYSSESGTTCSITYYTQRSVSYSTPTNVVTGNQVSAQFANGPYYISYGNDGLYEYTDRGIVVRVLEMDGSSSVVVREYYSEFSFDGNGRYVPGLPSSSSYTYPYSIEDDGALELKLYVVIDNSPLDTTTTIPAQIFMYRFVVPG